MGGSFGRIQGAAQWGKQIDNYAVYGALEGLHDNGFRNFSQSDIRRFYGDVGYRNDVSEFHLNMGVADNKFGAAATVPVGLLQNYWWATYTTPETPAPGGMRLPRPSTGRRPIPISCRPMTPVSPSRGAFPPASRISRRPPSSALLAPTTSSAAAASFSASPAIPSRSVRFHCAPS